jgi:Protein of unknown function (DUF2891)
MLDSQLAATFARIALTNVATEYPYKLDQVLGSDAEVLTPRTLHPVFTGSYDWHSCVHMHWTLARLLQLHPDHALAGATREHFDARLTAANTAGELATLEQPHRASFERPYGWGWLLKLAAELHLLAASQPQAATWRDSLAPLAQAFADRFVDFLPRATYPNRGGAHGNSAFALLLALDYCAATENRALHRLIVDRADRWFGRDSRYPADYEPSGDDFLSGGLVEAALMRRVLDDGSFADWWTQFQPLQQALSAWLQPVSVSDASDPKIVHLHGLNLSRAWCWRQLLPELDADLKTVVETAIEAHLTASLHAASRGDYVGTHWLASFALLALTEK